MGLSIRATEDNEYMALTMGNRTLMMDGGHIRPDICGREREKMTVDDLLAAYYSCGCDSEDLFRGFQIEKDASFREHLNRYDVIYLNMQQFLIRAKGQDVTECLEAAVIEELRESYGEFFPKRVICLAEALERIYARKEQPCVALAYMAGILPVKKYGLHSAYI